jgi:DNA-binding beta-propeller fold protein YncE
MTYTRQHLFYLGCFYMAAAIAVATGCDRSVVFPPDLGWEEPPVSPYINQPRVASTINGNDELSFVSTDSLDNPRLLGLATVGFSPIELEGPHHLATSPDGEYIYFNLSNFVTNGGSGPHGAHGTGTVPGYLVKFEVRNNRQIAEALVDRNPGDVILSTDGSTAFVSHYDLALLQQQLTTGAPAVDGYSSLYVIDTSSMTVLSQTVVCPTGHGMGLSPDGKTLYLVCTQSDQLAVLDVSDYTQPKILQKLNVGPAPGPVGEPAYAPYALSVYTDGTVWISDNGDGTVRVYDPKTMQMDPQRVIVVGGVAMFGDWTPDDKWFVVPHQGDDKVTAIEVATLNTVTLPLPKAACLNVHALHVLPPGPAVGIALVCEGDHIMIPGTVVFIDMPPDFVGWAVHGYVPVGLFPDGVKPLPALM